MTLVCFDAHRKDGLVWSINHRGKWLNFSHVAIRCPMDSDYKGPNANQPLAYFYTDEPVTVTVEGRVATIRRGARSR